MSKIKAARQEDVYICDMCGKEVLEDSALYKPRYTYDEKDFCSDICLSYYRYPTREDYLKGIRKGK